MHNSELLTTTETIKQVSISRRHLLRLAKDHKFPVYMKNGKRHYKIDEVRAYLERDDDNETQENKKIPVSYHLSITLKWHRPYSTFSETQEKTNTKENGEEHAQEILEGLKQFISKLGLPLNPQEQSIIFLVEDKGELKIVFNHDTDPIRNETGIASQINEQNRVKQLENEQLEREY